MQGKVIEFTNLLRKSGVRVSVAEAIDTFQSLDEVSLDDREIFKDALRASMVKRGDEIATYDQLFDLFWSGFYDSLQQGVGTMNADMAQMELEDIPRITAELLRRGYGEGEIRGILGENWLRVCAEVWLAPTPGHPPGPVAVRVASGGEEAFITGDMRMVRPPSTSPAPFAVT